MITVRARSRRARCAWRTVLLIAAVLCTVGAAAEDNDTDAGMTPPAAPGKHHYTDKTVEEVRQAEEDGVVEDDDERTNPPGVPGTGPVVKMLLWVGVVIALIYGGVYLIRRYVPSARNMFGSGVLKVVGRTYISSKQCILLIKVGAKYVMVGVTGTSMTPLAEVSDPDDARRIAEQLAAQNTQSIAGSFRKALSRADGEYSEDRASARADAQTDREVADLQRELDDVTQKMSTWRRGDGD